jgi:hypothetical protein
MTRPTLRRPGRLPPDPRARASIDAAGRLLGVDPSRLRRAIRDRELVPVRDARTGQDELVIAEARAWARERKAA